MNQKVKVEPVEGRMNALKWMVVMMLVVVGVGGNYMLSGSQPAYLRFLGLLVLMSFAVVIVFQTARGKQLWQFGLAAKNEMRKVVWPTRQETFQFTAMVLVLVMVMGLILWGVDIFLLKVVAMITGFGA